jgi:hypothetical protein
VPPVVYVDGIWITLMQETHQRRTDRLGRQHVVKRAHQVPILVAQGVWPEQNRREVLGWIVASGEDEASWEALLTQLEERGVRPERGLVLLVADGSPGLPPARETVRDIPDCTYLHAPHKHGYTTTVGRTHADGTVRLAREIPYGSPTWKKLFHRRNCAESRNSIQQHLGLKHLPVHGSPWGHSEVLLGDFIANQHTLVRLVREAFALRTAQSP